MSGLRRTALVLALLVAVVATPLAVSGFWVGHAQADADGFVARMQDAWAQGGVRDELTDQVQTAAAARVYEQFGVTGSGQNWLADLAVGFAGGQIEAGLSSEQFRTAWGEYHGALHADLAAVVRGDQPANIEIDGSVVTLGLAPLVSALDFGPLTGQVRGALGGDLLRWELETGTNLEGQLRALGTIWELRWFAALGAFAALVAAVLLNVGRRRGAALGLLAAAAGCLLTWIWRLLPVPAADGVTPTELSTAVGDAVVAGWDRWLLTAWVLLGVTGAALLLVTGRRGQTRATAGTGVGLSRADN